MGDKTTKEPSKMQVVVANLHRLPFYLGFRSESINAFMEININ